MKEILSKTNFENIYLILLALLTLVLIYLRLDLNNLPDIIIAAGVFVTFMIGFKIAYEDMAEMEITALYVYIALGIMLFINIIVLVLSGSTPGFNPLANISAGIILAGLIFLIITFSKGKAIGSGDVFVFGLSGLTLGAKSIVAFYIIIFSATIVGLMLAYRKGKLKGYRIPFVPFIVGGTFITYFFWSELEQVLQAFPMFYFITANG